LNRELVEGLPGQPYLLRAAQEASDAITAIMRVKAISLFFILQKVFELKRFILPDILQR
jgi:hypothetical protein